MTAFDCSKSDFWMQTIHLLLLRSLFGVQPGLRGDSYANLSLGNIYFSNLEDRTKYEKHLLHAANFYHEVLKKDDANAFSGTQILLWLMPLHVCSLPAVF